MCAPIRIRAIFLCKEWCDDDRGRSGRKTRRAATVYQCDGLSPANIGYDAGTLYLPDLLHNQILELAVR